MYVHVEWDFTDIVWTSKIYVYDKIHHVTSVPSYICVSKINSSHRNSICVFVENSPVYTLYYILIKLKNNNTFILNLTKISQNIRFLKMLNCVKQKKVMLKKEFRTHSCYFDLFYYNNVLGKAHW